MLLLRPTGEPGVAAEIKAVRCTVGGVAWIRHSAASVLGAAPASRRHITFMGILPAAAAGYGIVDVIQAATKG